MEKTKMLSKLIGLTAAAAPNADGIEHANPDAPGISLATATGNAANPLGDRRVPPANALAQEPSVTRQTWIRRRIHSRIRPSKESTMRKFVDTVLFVVAALAAASLGAAISAAALGFTHAALFVAGVTAAALATRRAARLLQLPLM